MPRTLLICIAVASATSPLIAAPIPLVEFNWQQVDFENGPLPATVEFSFIGFKQTPTMGQLLLNWTAQHGPADVGVSFWAPIEIVNDAVGALEVANVDYTFIQTDRGIPLAPCFCSMMASLVSVESAA